MSQYTRTNMICAPICAAIAATMLTTGVEASLIDVESQPENSIEGLGLFEGTIEYAPDINSNTQGILTINLLNTTPPDVGGFITGFVFNIGSGDSQATASLVSATHPFDGVTTHTAPPFGMSFDAGAALGGDWSGGGNPNLGIAVGDTGEFVFNIFASDANDLTAASFISGPYDHNFVVRFRGMSSGGSDKVPGAPINMVPAPGAMAMLLVAGILTSRRRNR